MALKDDTPLPVLQPDLEEFFSALNGLLTKQTASRDPSNIRFLEIFFRTVKSDKGHLLMVTETGLLKSVFSYGIDSQFDDEFNRSHSSATNEPSPLDLAFREKEAMAVVDMAKDPDIPDWFSRLMNKFDFHSLVAVPLMGADKPIGILCAYYNDVCLFDRATLDHLMMIGRMVGGAAEKTLVADQAESHGEKDKVTDQFIRILINHPFSKAQVYALLSKIFSEAVRVSGLICGPLTKTSQGLTLMAAAGVGLQPAILSNQIVLPPFLTTKFLSGLDRADSSPRTQSEWGEMQSIIDQGVSVEISHPILWQNAAEGAVIAWRSGNQKFDHEDEILLNRLIGIASLALHTA